MTTGSSPFKPTAYVGLAFSLAGLFATGQESSAAGFVGMALLIVGISMIITGRA